MAVNLTEQQKQDLSIKIKQGKEKGSYSDAYSYVRDIVDKSPVGGDAIRDNDNAGFINWLNVAASTNGKDGGLIDTVLRKASEETYKDNFPDRPYNEAIYDKSSNKMAEKLLNKIVENGITPHIGDVVKIDAENFHETFGGEWMGTMGDEIVLGGDWVQSKDPAGEILNLIKYMLLNPAINALDGNNLTNAMDRFENYLLPNLVDFSNLLHNLPDSISDFFKDALRWQPRRDPLTLDLDNDGLETVGTKDGVFFDHDGDGLKNKSGWVKPDDGFLVRDINGNGNGNIDNGSELFGDATRKLDGSLAKNGFDALADLDSNKDGKVDINDAAFASLKVWRDINGDGLTDSGELFTLQEVGVASFNTAEKEHSQILKNGNRLK
jgi:hypothetical protein